VRISPSLGILLAAAGCYQMETRSDDGRPGSDGWASRHIACETDGDCHKTESCLENICQMKRCVNGPYSSVPPLGPAMVFFHDRDPVVTDASMVDGASRIGAYRSVASGAVHDHNLAVQGRVTDVAGGHIWPDRAEELVIAQSGRSEVIIASSDRRESFDVGIVPVALTVADLDLDGTAEIIALAADGRVRVCDVASAACQDWDQLFEPGLQPVDIASGDIDGDGFPEAVVLGEINGRSRLIVLDFDAAGSGAPLTWGLIQGNPDPIYGDVLDRISVGDVTGDGVAEVVGTRHGSPNVFVYSMPGPASSRLLARWFTGLYDVRDVAVGDLDADDRDEVLLLRDSRRVRTLRARQSGDDLESEVVFESTLHSTQTPERIAAVDFDGDSPRARLVEGPILHSGRPQPLFVAYYPPYWAQFSHRPANVYVGESDLTTEHFEDTIYASRSIELGVEVSALGLFKAGLSGKVGQKTQRSQFSTHVSFVGTRVWTQADTSLYGPQYAAVLMSATCAHQYLYEVEDPSSALPESGDGARFTLMVPVDGSTLLMASQRYNALARALGDLPEMQIPHRIGDPTTYPREMLTVEGWPIPEEDKVVADPPIYVVSDVGYLGFWLALWDYQGTSTALETTLGVKAHVGAPGFKFGAEVGAGWGKQHRIQIGKEAVFGGSLPTLPNNPNTPEDEFARYAYSFAPIVYRAHYTDALGNDLSYYVFHFMAGLP
jgi:hypothetical protein